MVPLWTLPCLAALSLIIPFVLCFVLAVQEGHVDPWLPYISDLGAFSPESNIFGQFLNIAAVLLMVCFYIRDLQVRLLLGSSELWLGKGETLARTRRLSGVFTVLAFLAACGLSVVANFQENLMPVVHLTGAMVCFVFGNVYCHGQTLFTFRMAPFFVSSALAWLRLLIASVSTAALVLQASLGYVSRTKGGRYTDGYLHWDPADPGYSAYLTSALAEWVLGISFILYILTFVWELRHSQLEWDGMELVGTLKRRADDHMARMYQAIPGDEDYPEDLEERVLRIDTLLGTPYQKTSTKLY